LKEQRTRPKSNQLRSILRHHPIEEEDEEEEEERYINSSLFLNRSVDQAQLERARIAGRITRMDSCMLALCFKTHLFTQRLIALIPAGKEGEVGRVYGQG
jgi:hypothetical protein